MSCSKGFLLLALLAFCAPALVMAEYPEACKLVQDCVDQAVASDRTACLSAQPSCDLNDFANNKTDERFAVSSGELAERSKANVATRMGIASCGAAPTKRRCYICYNLAIKPLRDRLYGKLFHGVLVNAALLLNDEKNEVCSAME